MKENFELLKEYKHLLNKQQYKTLKGQLIKGDIEGFRKGLFKLAKINYLRKWLNEDIKRVCLWRQKDTYNRT